MLLEVGHSHLDIQPGPDPLKAKEEDEESRTE
jgi:hypothetical protein